MLVVDNKVDFSALDFLEGALLLIDKPKEWSSFSVVNKIRWTLRYHYDVKKIKVGHAGTLDPMATGLLLVCVGPYTKRIEKLMGMEKRYSATIKLGAQTASYDAETPEENIVDSTHVKIDDVEASLNKFRGEIEQYAPIYSALKIDGQPMYKLARKGQIPERKKRRIVIHDISIDAFNTPYIEVNLRCSKGCYVRSLAHDLGNELEVGAYLTSLKRTQIGNYKLEYEMSIDEFYSKIKSLECQS